MKRKKKKSTPVGQKNCHNCPAILIEPKNPQFRHYQRHGLCSACLANEIDALNEKLSRGGIVNEDVEAQNLVMVKALQYYGDKRNYGILGGTRIRVDKGNRAREAMTIGLSKGNVRAITLPKEARCPECDTVHQPLADGILCHACTS